MRSNKRVQRQYLEELGQQSRDGLIKESTLAQRKKAVGKFIQFLNDRNINLKSLNSTHIRDFLQYLTQKINIRQKRYASATIIQMYALSKSFYVHCYERGVTTRHPDLIFIKNLLRHYKLGERKLPKYIGQERMKELLNQCPDRWQALLHFMYDTGARISEVLGVQYRHLDLERKRVEIYEPKTMNVRVTTLSDNTISLLRQYFLTYRPKPRKAYENYVFINQQRRKMSPRAVQYVVKDLSSKILGKNNAITPHYFRAACAVHLLEGGVDIRQVQEIIGWKSLSVVQNYTRVTPQRQAELKEKFHPGFQNPNEKEQVNVTTNEKKDSWLGQQFESLQRQLKEEQKKQEQDRQRYEKRIDELIEKQQQMQQQQQQMQQQIIQLLMQNSPS
ncbi:MAG: tyrosine-type recombinase/integrase [Candidatus Hodarchaeota archaeon]